MRALAILVAGGPAPGINAAIAAATIEARNCGLRVVGCYDGFEHLAAGDAGHMVHLDIRDVSTIHFDGGSILRTSRSRATREAGAFERVGRTLAGLGADLLVTIGGEGTAYAAWRLAQAAPGLRIAHVPKTIDNDLPLPGGTASFGFATACNLGKDLVRNLMQDAAATRHWYFVTVMGRHTGHLALGIGGAAAATLTLIPEEFAGGPVTLDALAAILEGAVVKRRAHGREHGVAILAEGLAALVDPATLGPIERDAVGRLRLSEIELGRLLRGRVRASLDARGVPVTIVEKDLGYELRCAPPGAQDIQYARSLGYWATRYLLDGGGGAMIALQDGHLTPLPLDTLLDPASGTLRVRRVDLAAEAYRTLAAYMIRLTPEDLADPAAVAALADAGGLCAADVLARFGPVVGRRA